MLLTGLLQMQPSFGQSGSVQQIREVFAADDFLATGLEVGISIHTDDFETHVVGFVEGHDGGCAKSFGKVITEEAGLDAAEV